MEEEGVCKAAAKRFRAFRRDLYGNDPLYVSTAEFITDMLLLRQTAFAKSCEIRPVFIGNPTRAQCLLIRAPRTDFLQISFFDCLQNDFAAAEALFARAREAAKQSGCKRIVAGLNAHLSYGVGLAYDVKGKNTFDTCYNKTYYDAFFRGFAHSRTLTAYRCNLSQVRERFKNIPCGGLTVREADMSHFKRECETMRRLCDETIGETYLYAPTDEGHFYDLLKDMKLLLHGENLLFLLQDGKEKGFLFWHPDYNGALQSGKRYGALSFACAYACGRKRVDTVKLNSVGVVQSVRNRGTLALLSAMNARIGDRYGTIETNFVWDCNEKSTLLNRRLLQDECRKFKVYEDEI